MLKNLPNAELFLAPLRKQEAVISSRMEGTVSTMDEIFQYEADHDDGADDINVRQEVKETKQYQDALKDNSKSNRRRLPNISIAD